LIDILLCFCFSAQFASQLSIFEAFRPVEVAGNIGTAYLPMKVESDVLIWSLFVCWKCLLESSFLFESEFRESKLFSDI
jgi:hypothetical protein